MTFNILTNYTNIKTIILLYGLKKRYHSSILIQTVLKQIISNFK